jgi:E1A/CREB-binding protein
VWWSLQDGIISNSLVDSRHTFLEMCQFRHYQFDTLRRAKHSSSMVLYYLLNPASPTLRVACTHCKETIPPGGLRWHCGQCSNVDICTACYDGDAHRHQMTPFRISFRTPAYAMSP